MRIQEIKKKNKPKKFIKFKKKNNKLLTKKRLKIKLY
jgi:hypothetical protein